MSSDTDQEVGSCVTSKGGFGDLFSALLANHVVPGRNQNA